jgi:hypothetical protein
MADKTNLDRNQGVQLSKLEYGETQPPRNDEKEQRGGPQDDQITGEVEKGAHNQRMQGRNPQGNPPDSR